MRPFVAFFFQITCEPQFFLYILAADRLSNNLHNRRVKQEEYDNTSRSALVIALIFVHAFAAAVARPERLAENLDQEWHACEQDKSHVVEAHWRRCIRLLFGEHLKHDAVY